MFVAEEKEKLNDYDERQRMQVLIIISTVVAAMVATAYQHGMRSETFPSPEDTWGLIIIGLALIAMGMEESR
jgi:undecaprenyl pyrophosphate phosphatase UppP